MTSRERWITVGILIAIIVMVSLFAVANMPRASTVTKNWLELSVNISSSPNYEKSEYIDSVLTEEFYSTKVPSLTLNFEFTALELTKAVVRHKVIYDDGSANILLVYDNTNLGGASSDTWSFTMEYDKPGWHTFRATTYGYYMDGSSRSVSTIMIFVDYEFYWYGPEITTKPEELAITMPFVVIPFIVLFLIRRRKNDKDT